MKKDLQLFVFTDFDGTITIKDIGDELFRKYSKFDFYIQKLLSGEITIHQYWIEVCKNLDKNLNIETIRQFALSFEVDPYFKQFACFCEQNQVQLSIVSDGFDTYINPIIQSLQLNKIEIFCNTLIFEKKNIIPIFPYASESCKCLCASCKRNTILSNIPENAVIVFIGDGFSDYCAAEHSDIIFAKDKLAAYCNENKIPHYPFSTFLDVRRILEDIIRKKKYKIRNQARLLRKKAYETE
jgi:2,3-diketo-5-methylthio-1-phosphopentane phosphatase